MMKKQSGQVVIEYVLLMIITASIALLLIKGIASRNPDNPGILAKQWCYLIEAIGNDLPEDKQSAPTKKSDCPQ